MKCKFEHDGDCCNSGSPQYMCKCKPDVCHSAVPMTNGDRIRAMGDEELAEHIWKKFGCPNGKNNVTCGYVGECRECWAEWLQQSAKED